MGEAIRVVSSFLEESYEPTRSIGSLAYGLGMEQASGFRHYSNLRFDSFCHLGRICLFGITASLGSLLLFLGRRTQRDLLQLRFDTSSTSGTRANGRHGLFTSAKPGVSRGVFSFQSESEKRQHFFSITELQADACYFHSSAETGGQLGGSDTTRRFVPLLRLYNFTLSSSLGDFDGRKLADHGILYVLCTTPAAFYFGSEMAVWGDIRLVFSWTISCRSWAS